MTTVLTSWPSGSTWTSVAWCATSTSSPVRSRDLADRVRDRDLSEVCGTEPVTVEILAAWIHERLAGPLGGDGAEVVSVRVWESPEAFGGIRARV